MSPLPFVEPLVFFACLLAGPFIVARFFPKRTGVAGTHLVGQSGMPPMFWGVPAGLFAAIAILLVIYPPTVYANTLELIQNILLLFVVLIIVSAPLLIWGAHFWSWDAVGLEFRSLFRRRKVAWSEITKVTPAREGGFSVSTSKGAAFRTSRYVAGNDLIMAALHHYRPSAIG